MKYINSIAIFLVALLITVGFSQPSLAQNRQIDNPDIQVGVNGLACPFCAYGIEKKLRKIEVIENLFVNIKNGTIDLKIKKGTTLSEENIRQVVDEAGFEVRSIEYVNEAVKPKTNSDA